MAAAANGKIADARALPVNAEPSVLASVTPAIPAPTAAPPNTSALATCAVSTAEAVL